MAMNKFLCMAKGGGSANKTYLYQETKALITPAKLKNYLVEKCAHWGPQRARHYSHRVCHWRYVSRKYAENRQTGVDPLLMGLQRRGMSTAQAFRDVPARTEHCYKKRRISA